MPETITIPKSTFDKILETLKDTREYLVQEEEKLPYYTDDYITQDFIYELESLEVAHILNGKKG